MKRPLMKRALTRQQQGTLVLSVILVTAMLASLLVGSVPLSLNEVLAVISGGTASSVVTTIVQEIRLPRVLLAVLVGAGVASAGASIQGLFRNPLADPALIGISSGAALFASVFIVLGGGTPLVALGTAGSAFLGGLTATWIVLLVGHRGVATMLLAGIAINAIALSGVGLLSFLSTDGQLRSVTFWALGSLNGADWTSVILALVIPFTIVLFVRDAVRLNAMTLGDEEAGYLGVNIGQFKIRIVILCAVAVGIGVALTGVIAFVGLIVPHLVRVVLGSNHAVVIPCSALAGGLLLLVADTFSRTLFAPIELPVGILTALLGGPFFLYLILRSQQSRQML